MIQLLLLFFRLIVAVGRDFDFFIMDEIFTIRYVGGFARATTIKPEDYWNASPDPLVEFGDKIVDHMNKDHKDSLENMIRRYLAVPCSSATLISVDKMGMMVRHCD